MGRRRKRLRKSIFKEHSYLAILLTLVILLFMFAFTAPISFNGELTGRAVELIQTNPQVTALSFFILLFGILLLILLLILFTHNLMSKVL